MSGSDGNRYDGCIKASHSWGEGHKQMGVFVILLMRPHLWATVWSPIDNLWRSVERAATEGLQQLVLVVEVRQPEISNLCKQENGESLTQRHFR